MRDKLMTLAATPFPRALTTWGAMLLVALAALGLMVWDGSKVWGAVTFVLLAAFAFVVEKRLTDYKTNQETP